MAAKSFGTPSVMPSPVVSRQTTGSNHIWKTSSGKSDLKSHFTVSHRLGVRVEEGMDERGWAGLFTLRRRTLLHHVKFASSAFSRGNEIRGRQPRWGMDPKI